MKAPGLAQMLEGAKVADAADLQELTDVVIARLAGLMIDRGRERGNTDWLDGVAYPLELVQRDLDRIWKAWEEVALDEEDEDDDEDDDQGEPDPHGALMDYNTGEYLRPATAAERARSFDAGGEGVVTVQGRRVYVSD